MDGGQAKPGYIYKQHVDAKEVQFMICHKKNHMINKTIFGL